MSSFYESREWMYKRLDEEQKCVSNEYIDGINAFLHFAKSQASYKERQKLLCPCRRCNNLIDCDANTVGSHLYMKGFTANYYVWSQHGEICYDDGEASTRHFRDDHEMWADLSGNIQEPVNQYHDPYEDVNMVPDEAPIPSNFPEPLYAEICHDTIFQALEAADQPLYDGCADGISQLYLASKVMSWKTNYHVADACLDEITQTFKKVLPSPNKALESYYETKKLTRSLGLPYHKIDVCEDNCMLFWRGRDQELLQCRFCKKDRYEPNSCRLGKKIPKQRMFYLPITDRLKRLYMLEATAKHMRWHNEHLSPEGEMQHPSDGEAWKHFNNVYPDFALESRNIYLGLSTDGFNPIGMNGQAHLVWPVIVTPYNLPPGMCMRREYFYLSVLVPGPKHPKKSLDIYLQPLIEELKSLWSVGVDAFDVSMNQEFKMRVALMWTISDFPAYGMLSGWTTHGRLACPYCLDDSKAFWLSNGRKHSWFDCHRAFLPKNHPYRRNSKAFRKGKIINDDPPPWLTGEEILHERINSIRGLSKTIECGGNGHNNPSRTIEGYGDYHNWVKKSIFWDLPYWKELILRHNLDFMHIEKNFFDNIINTLLNVPGKTKDNVKSRMDLPSICKRPDLELTEDGKAPVPIFRLSKESKQKFLLWLFHEIKFPDGYASKFSRCVDMDNWKLSGLKSHDCHVIMQRLLPIAFTELLQKNVHTAISDIALFFRDISAKTLKTETVAVLKANIAVKLCNLEKIFPPSFFDVMEHLPVHLPDEALLGGPVQYRWMYPFERYMYHLKKMVKNKARIAGSIVAQCVNEEVSYMTSNYLGRHNRLDSLEEFDGKVLFTYNYPDVPTIFQPVGRVAGKPLRGLLSDRDFIVLQTFLLRNCEAFAPYERMFEEHMMERIPNISPETMNREKSQHFAEWTRKYMNDASKSYIFPFWMLEFVQGPNHQITSWPMYYSRGYHYHTEKHGQDKKTHNYGVCVRGTTDAEYYGLIEEIFMIEYDGVVKLKTMIFRCKWFDTTLGRGTRKHPSGIVDVCPRRRYEVYDPFILPEQCDQVCFVPYPRLRSIASGDWWATTKVIPRGFRESAEVAQTAFQDEIQNNTIRTSSTMRVETRAVFPTEEEYEPLPNIDPDDEYVSEDDLQDSCDDSDSDSNDDS